MVFGQLWQLLGNFGNFLGNLDNFLFTKFAVKVLGICARFKDLRGNQGMFLFGRPNLDWVHFRERRILGGGDCKSFYDCVTIVWKMHGK